MIVILLMLLSSLLTATHPTPHTILHRSQFQPIFFYRNDTVLPAHRTILFHSANFQFSTNATTTPFEIDYVSRSILNLTVQHFHPGYTYHIAHESCCAMGPLFHKLVQHCIKKCIVIRQEALTHPIGSTLLRKETYMDPIGSMYNTQTVSRRVTIHLIDPWIGCKVAVDGIPLIQTSTTRWRVASANAKVPARPTIIVHGSGILHSMVVRVPWVVAEEVGRASDQRISLNSARQRRWDWWKSGQSTSTTTPTSTSTSTTSAPPSFAAIVLSPLPNQSIVHGQDMHLRMAITSAPPLALYNTPLWNWCMTLRTGEFL